MTTTTNDSITKLFMTTMDNAMPMDKSGRKFFSKSVDRSLIVFPEWQRTETSNPNRIAALRANFDQNLMDPLLLVAWPEDECFHCANGYHRFMATETIKEMEQLPCVILIGPDSVKERKKFEIDLFLKQSASIETLKAIQMHSARLEIGDSGATTLQDLCDKYNIAVVEKKGQRAPRALGSYDGTYGIAKKADGKKRLSNIFEVLDIAGYMEESNGLSCKIINPLDNILQGFPFVKISLGEMMRKMSPSILCAKAAAKYPERGWRVQLTLFLQDWIVDTYHVAPRFDKNGKKIVEAA